jgi:hypothetical protein
MVMVQVVNEYRMTGRSLLPMTPQCRRTACQNSMCSSLAGSRQTGAREKAVPDYCNKFSKFSLSGYCDRFLVVC